MSAKSLMRNILCLAILISIMGCEQMQRKTDFVLEPYLLNTGLVSRSISFENPTGAPGEGGKAASKLGIGRKGKPAITRSV